MTLLWQTTWKEGSKNTILLKQSLIYETKPIGYTQQDTFLNMAIKIHTNLSPHDLLKHCLTIEQQMWRTRTIPQWPRIIDIDIIFYDTQIISTHTLIMPHPRYHLRDFVLQPLLDIDPKLTDPQTNKSLKNLLKKVSDKSIITFLRSNW